MKKIISVLLAVVLVFALCAIPASATTSKSEWQKQNGPGKLEFNEQGVKCVLDEGLTFFKYTKETIDVKNFTCTFFPYYEEQNGSFYAMTLTASKPYTGPGSNGLFILLRFAKDGVVNVEGQILHVGYYLTGEPPQRNKDIQVDTTKPLTIKGVDNGNGTYTISFEGGTGEYTFEIPENYQFTEDANGQGYFSFGGSMGEDKRAITVVSVNGIDFSGNKPEPESTSKPTSSGQPTTSDSTTTDDGLIIGADDTTTTGDVDTDSEADSNSTLIIVIIVCGVLILAAVTVAVVIVIKKKKTAELSEETEKDSAE